MEKEVHLEKEVTSEKLCHTYKNESRVEKCVTLGKKGSNLQKCVKLGKMGHTWKNGFTLEIWVTLGK